MPASIAAVNGIEVCYETFGSPDDPALLFVSGLGSQMLSWDENLCAALVDRGFFVVRFDNRDVGLSSKIDTAPIPFLEVVAKAMAGEQVDAPYLLSDMAADTVGLLDHLGIDAAHLVGASMGGMIAQTVAIEHPDRVLTLTSIMSTTGEPDVGTPTAEALQRLITRGPPDRDGAVEHTVETFRIIGSPDHFEEDVVRARAERGFDRCFYPIGVGRQLVGIWASGPRVEGLRELRVPTLVIHGAKDPLVTLSGGQRTAELVPEAELLVIDEMGHDLPRVFWPQIIDAITRHAARVEAASQRGGR